MPLATINQNTVITPITLASMTAGVQTAMTNAGYTLFDSISGSTNTLIYRQVFNASTKGTVYIKIDITASSISHQIGDNWNTATDTGTNFLGSGTVSYNTTNSITFYSYSHPEVRLVVGQQGNSIHNFGYIRPNDKPAWWNENNHLYAFAPYYNTTFSDYYFANPNPFNTTDVNSVGISEIGLYNLNPDNSRDLLVQPFLYGKIANAQVLLGKFSSDVCVGPSIGTTFQDVFKLNTSLEEYSVVYGAKGSIVTQRYSSLAVRIL